MDDRITDPDDPRAPDTETMLAHLDQTESEGWTMIEVNTVQFRYMLNYIDKQQQHILNITGDQP